MNTEMLDVDTSRRRIVDLTSQVRDFCASQHGSDGLCNVFVPHATAGVAVIETGAGSDDDLVDTLYEAGGVGLAANQVGVGSRVFVYDCPDGDRSAARRRGCRTGIWRCAIPRSSDRPSSTASACSTAATSHGGRSRICT